MQSGVYTAQLCASSRLPAAPRTAGKRAAPEDAHGDQNVKVGRDAWHEPIKAWGKHDHSPGITAA